ncbi:hypothetical protein Tco_0760770 [Tanacetum coccineum]
MLTLEGFSFITVNTKEYHSECSDKITRTMRRTLIDPITEPDYKYLNKNDTEDMYLLCINDKVKNHRETGLLGLLVVFISVRN